MVMFRDQNAGRSHSIKTDNSSIETVVDFKIFGNNLNKSKFYSGEIKSRLISRCAYCHSVQNILSSSLLSKNFKIKIYRTIILLVVVYGCETWLLTLKVERRLRVFENRVLRRIFGPRANRGLEKTT